MNMNSLAVIYHSAQGHTEHIASHVADGARCAPNTKVELLKAEDMAKVLTLNTQAVTEAGHFTEARMTEDTTPLHPEIAELKFYAPGVGLVMERQVRGGQAMNDLTEFTAPN